MFACRLPLESARLRVSADGFEYPASHDGGVGAFLKLDVTATRLGCVRDPCIRIGEGAFEYPQYLERSASGSRYLNLSPISSRFSHGASRRVRLHGERIRWRPEATLLLFEAPAIAEESMMVLAPHPDDAEIAAFGLYASHPSSAWVVTVTAGEWGSSDLSPVVCRPNDLPRWHAFLRVWDSMSIPQLGGVPLERSLNLVYPNDALSSMFRQPMRPFRLGCEAQLPRATLRSRNREPSFSRGTAECTWTDLVSEIGCLLDKTRPGVVVAPHPLLDQHLDHAFTTVALQQAIAGGAKRPHTVLLYVVHPYGTSGHPWGKSDGVVSLPPVPPGLDEQWLADSIYSHQLPPDLQAAKYFAVEAAHDLRTYDRGGPKSLDRVLRTTVQELRALVRGVGVDRTSFLRRAPRPNELFHVVSPDSLSDLVQLFLERSQ